MKGFVGIGRADHVETAITDATAGLKKADFLILIAPFSKIEAAAALLGEKYPGTPMIGTSGEGIAKEMRLTQAVIVIGFAGVEVCTGVIEDVRTTPVKSMHTFLSNLQAIEPGDSDTICLEFMTGCEERVLSTIHDSLQEAGVPLIGASAYGVLLGEKHCVILDGKVHTRSCAYAFIKNKGGKIHLYKENIYKRQPPCAFRQLGRTGNQNTVSVRWRSSIRALPGGNRRPARRYPLCHAAPSTWTRPWR